MYTKRQAVERARDLTHRHRATFHVLEHVVSQSDEGCECAYSVISRGTLKQMVRFASDPAAEEARLEAMVVMTFLPVGADTVRRDGWAA